MVGCCGVIVETFHGVAHDAVKLCGHRRVSIVSKSRLKDSYSFLISASLYYDKNILQQPMGVVVKRRYCMYLRIDHSNK